MTRTVVPNNRVLSAVDRRDLKWLEIGHYASAGFALLWTGVAWFFVSRVGGAFAQAQSAPQAAANHHFMEVAMVAGVAFQASFIVTLVLAGLLVRRRAAYRTCFVLSIWNLVFMPFGTIAGIFAFVLLRRPSIESVFQQAATISAETPALESPQPGPIPIRTPVLDPMRAEADLHPLPALHYALAALTFLFGSFPVIHVGVGLAMLLNPEFASNMKEGDPQLIGALFLGVGLLLIGMLWATAGAIALAGRFLSQRRRHTFCVVVCAVNCMFFPFGTALGVYTLIVLNRDYVKAEFFPPPQSA